MKRAVGTVLIVSLFLFLCLTRQVKANPDSAISNGGFETGDLTDWDVDGTWAVGSTYPHTGTYCMQKHTLATGDTLNQTLSPSGISSDDITEVSVWSKWSANMGQKMRLYYTDESYTEISVFNGDDWVKFTLTPDAGKTCDKIGFYITNGVASYLILDDVVVTYTPEVKHSVTFYYNEGGQLEINGSLTANGTEIEYNQNDNITLKAYPDGSMLFVNYTWNGNTNTTNPYTLTIADNYTVWCYFESPPESTPATNWMIIPLAMALAAIALVLKHRQDGEFDE